MQNGTPGNLKYGIFKIYEWSKNFTPMSACSYRYV